jgi:hypothetical protein
MKYQHYPRLLKILAMICLVWMQTAAFAQEVTVDNACISIPAGAVLNTGGGITLQNKASIDNSGTIVTAGNWTNNGKGLVHQSHGTVILNGSSQVIDGSSETEFYNLSLAGNGEKKLCADISIMGNLDKGDRELTAGGYTVTMLCTASNAGSAQPISVKTVVNHNSDLQNDERSKSNAQLTATPFTMPFSNGCAYGICSVSMNIILPDNSNLKVKDHCTPVGVLRSINTDKNFTEILPDDNELPCISAAKLAAGISMYFSSAFVDAVTVSELRKEPCTDIAVNSSFADFYINAPMRAAWITDPAPAFLL